MARNIEQIMELFQSGPEWGMSKLSPPDKASLLELQKTYPLPEDYVKIQSVTDGFVLFQAGDYRMNDLKFILKTRSWVPYNLGLMDSVVTVGYFMGYDIVINQRESRTASYLYAGDSGSDFIRIGTITDFFNGLIESKGELPFWESKGQELFDFSADNLPQNPGVLEVPARGRRIVSTRPYYPSPEEIHRNGLDRVVTVEYSNGTETIFFLRDGERID